jgi:asparagine synthase (glutamine-hydrolysing)
MHVVGCVGLSHELRQAYLSRVESGVRIFDWLHVDCRELPSSTVVCAVNALTRVSVQRTESSAQLYVGSVRRPDDVTFEASVDSSRGASRYFSQLEGELYLAFASSQDGACCVGVDSLGLFPLYYYSTSDFFLFSSSLWAFGQHPHVSAAIDLDGLIGILLSQGPVGGRTLVRGVTRLAPGYAVTWRPGRSATEHPVNRLTPTAALFGASFDEQLDAVDTALRSATARVDSHMILLSGGLDSRLVAGYLGAARGADVQAVSLGSDGQFDPAFAKRVASRLSWRHRSIDVDMAQFLPHARVQVRHEQLAGSFWDLAFWQLVTELGARNPVLATGFCGNSALEPLRHDPNQTDFTFARLFKACNKYGFRPETLRTLIRGASVDERIAAVIERLRHEYEAFDCEPFQKVLMFDLAHRARFLVGAVVWRLSFGMQPTIPYADRALLTACLGLPVTAFRARTLQKTLLRRRFPELARVPLDTASFFTRPLMPTIGDRGRHLASLLYHGLVSRRERRYYHSVFDLNGPGWRAVRTEAEKSRAKAESLLDRDTLLRLLPPPDDAIRTGATEFFQEGSRKKSLLALMLWASDNL